MNRIVFCFLLVFISFHSNAQIIPFAIEPVKIADFSPSSSLVTPDIDAVYLQDKGETILDATPQTGFYTKFHYFRRLLIVNKSALSELAKGQLVYNAENDGKKLKTLHVSTYNLENGHIVKTDLPEGDRYVEDPKQSVHTIKYAYPNAKVGSILEVEYTITSGSVDLKDWYFQTAYPVLHSSYSVSLPSNWNFVITLQNKGYLTSTKKDSLVKNIYSWKFEYENIKVYTVNWTFDNVPAMKTEPYTSTIANYIGCIKFQLAVRPINPESSEKLLNNWQWINDWFLADYGFGVQIDNPNPWIYKLSKSIVQPEDDELTKARKIYSYLSNHLKCVSRGIVIEDGKTLDQVYKSGQGNTAEINLILVALLRTQKLHADAVILATRDKGVTNAEYPVMDNFNYTICKLNITGKNYYLDASQPTLGFGRLPAICYNGQARVINKIPLSINLSADSIRESQVTSVTLTNDPSSKNLLAEWTDRFGYYASTDLRQIIRDHSNGQDSVLKSYAKEKVFSGSVDSFTIENIKNLDVPVTLHFNVSIPLPGDNYFYFNPMMNAGLGNNPFKAATRNYPVELPYLIDNTFLLNMDIPEGYEVDELPKSTRVKLNENDGMFEYLIQKNETNIQFKCVFNLKKATFDPDDYNNLREFYAFVIKKQAEQIVFRKIKK